MQGDVDQYHLLVAHSLFYLWLAFVVAAPVAFFIAKPCMENRRTLSLAAYTVATACWLLFFYVVLPPLIADWRFGGMLAAVLLCLSPWVLSWIIFLLFRPGNPVGSMRKDESVSPGV